MRSPRWEKSVHFVCAALLASVAASAIAQAGPQAAGRRSGGWTLDQLALLALSPIEGLAVVQFPDRSMKILAIGETVPGTDAIVSKVLADKLVLEESTSGTPGRDVVWLQPSPAGQAARIQRFSTLHPSDPVPQPPTTISTIVPGPGTDAAGPAKRRR